MKITYTQYAWADLSFRSIEGIKDGTGTATLSDSAPGTGGYFERQGYASIGTAEVTLTIHSNDEIVTGQIKSLNTQLEAVRAESQQKENAILLQISKLQALTMSA